MVRCKLYISVKRNYKTQGNKESTEIKLRNRVKECILGDEGEQ